MRRNKTWKCIGLTTVATLVLIPHASANIVGVFNTGVDGAGALLAAGQSDLHYTLISAPAGAPLLVTVTVPNPNWTQSTATANWIGPGSDGNTAWPAGNYDYQTKFDLNGLDPATARIAGAWASDNAGCIELNGVNTGNCTDLFGYRVQHSFLLAGGFVAGINTLDFLVNNESGPTGVFVELSGTAAPSPSPEPAFLIPSVAVMALFAFQLRRWSAPRQFGVEPR